MIVAQLLAFFGVCVQLTVDDHFRSFESPMYDGEKEYLRNLAKNMFQHSFDAYKKAGFGNDEVRPVACNGVNYPDINFQKHLMSHNDEVLGNFSLTLLESLSTLALMGDITNLLESLKFLNENLRFDNEVIVSVFETNIRALGSLLSAHVLTAEINKKLLVFDLSKYSNFLLPLAVDLADRLLASFTASPTGVPYPRLNLKTLIPVIELKDTSISDVGSFILEFGTLTILTQNPKYINAANKMLDILWNISDKKTGKILSRFDMDKLEFTSKISTAGAGSDSYYEYLLKSYIQTGNIEHYERFKKHYGYLLQNNFKSGIFRSITHENNMSIPVINFDSLQSFWPSLSILDGDYLTSFHHYFTLAKAVMTYGVLPDQLTIKELLPAEQSYSLRPEFIESTYHLYKATKDPFFLQIGKYILLNIEKYAKSNCGYAEMNFVGSYVKTDKTHTFLFSEVFKYLYLLFTNDEDIPVDLSNYVFSTEGHPLPIFVSKNSPESDLPLHSCRAVNMSDVSYLREIRKYLFQKLEERSEASHSWFSDANPQELDTQTSSQKKQFSRRGVLVCPKSKNSVSLNITTKSYKNNIANMAFFYRMLSIRTYKKYIEEKAFLKLERKSKKTYSIQVGKAMFGKMLSRSFDHKAPLVRASPEQGCTKLRNAKDISGSYVLLVRGGCNFVQKVRNAQRAGAIGAIIYTLATKTSDVIINMISEEFDEDILIPAVFFGLLSFPSVMDELKTIISKSNKTSLSEITVSINTDILKVSGIKFV